MAVAWDATGAGNTSVGTAISWTHTITNPGFATYVLVGVTISVSSNSTATTCTATYGGVAMTLLSGSLTLLGSSTNRSAIGIFYLANPATGAQTVTVTPAGASTKARVAANSVSYSGVGSIGSQQSAASLTLSATSVLSGYDFAVSINGAAISLPTQTTRYNSTASVGGVGDSIQIQDAAGTGNSISFSSSGTATTPTTLGVALSPTASFSTLTERFDSSAAWTLASGATIANGVMSIDVTGATPYGQNNTLYGLVGTSVSIQLFQLGTATGGNADNYLLRLSPTLSGANVADFVISAGTLFFHSAVGGVDDFGHSTTYTPGLHTFFRLREAAGTLFWDTSPNGFSWTTGYSVANPFLLTGLYLFSQTATAGTGVLPMVVDNVNMFPGAKGNINRAPMIRSSLY